MKREIERSRKLPAFSIGLAELEVLRTRVVDMFDSDKPLNAYIDISLQSEKLKFTSIDDLRKRVSMTRGYAEPIYQLARWE